MRYKMKKCFLFALLFLVFLGAQATKKATKAVTAAIQAVQSEEVFCSATIGCYAVNLTQGKVIGDVDATRSMIPASTLKLLTTAAALETLGRD
jgi:D-alanyl-D-alanine carboxypeptidase